MSRFASFWPGFGAGGALKRDMSNLAPHPDSSKHTGFVRGDGTIAPVADTQTLVAMPVNSAAAGAPGQVAYENGVFATYIGAGGGVNWIFINAYEKE